MTQVTAVMVEKIKELTDSEKLEIVDEILAQLDKPDPDVDRVWAEEAQKRFKKYKAGEACTVAYDDVMAGYKRR